MYIYIYISTYIVYTANVSAIDDDDDDDGDDDDDDDEANLSLQSGMKFAFHSTFSAFNCSFGIK
jgi:hypothetical protein